MSQDIGRDVFNGLIQTMRIGKQTRHFINLNSAQRILYVLYIPVYPEREIIQPGFCVGKAHGRYFSAEFVTLCFSSDELSDLLTAGQRRSQNYFWVVVQTLIQFENQVVEWHYYSTEFIKNELLIRWGIIFGKVHL